MNRKLGIGITVLTLFGHAAAIPPDGPIILDPFPDEDGKPAIPTPHPTAVNPFVDSVRVTLDSQGNSQIYYDWGQVDEKLDENSPTIQKYAGEQIPIRETGFLKTLSMNPNGSLGYAQYHYIRDANPVVGFQTPASGQSVKIGAVLALTATVSDGDNTAPFTVKYSRFTGTEWRDLGTGTGTAPHKYDWTVDAPAGSAMLRVIAYDAHMAADTATVSITVSANSPPTVAWVRPANNSSFFAPASFTLEANPSDADGIITKVEFYQDGVLLGADSDGAPWVWDRANLPEKAYVFRALAYDNGSTSLTGFADLTVNVVRNKAPAVAITVPQNGKTYYAPYNANVAATATDSDGTVAKVEFFIGNSATPDFTDASPPFGYTKIFSANSYTLTAKAYDGAGLVTTSDPVTFTVAANQRPTARPGNDTVIVLPASSVPLKGGGSSDPEGGKLRFKWSGPGATFSPSDTIANPIAQFQNGSAGTFRLMLKVTDDGVPTASDSAFITVVVQSKPVITSAVSASGPSNTPFSYTMTATGYPLPTLEATGRPAWLNFNPANGVLSGTPTGGAANYSIGLTARNEAGTDTKTLAIAIGDSLFKPRITSALTAFPKVGTAFTYTITATGNPSNFTYAATGLPNGLALAGAVISGTPTVTGPYPVNLTVTNSQGNDQKVLGLTIGQDPKITEDLPDSLPTIMEKGKATFSIKAVGYPAISYQWQFSPNPATTGYINIGTNSPTYVIDSATLSSAGSYRVIVKNDVGPSAVSKVCRIKVTPLPTPMSIAAGGQPASATVLIGEKAQFKVVAAGQTQPYWYNWFKDGKLIAGARTDTNVYVIESASEASAGTYRVRVANKDRDTVNPASYAWSDNAVLTVQYPKLAKPEARPPGGPFHPQAKVVLVHATTGAVIHYTLDGTEPSLASPKYNPGDTLRLSASTTVKAMATGAKFRTSDVMAETYTYTQPNQVTKPAFTPASTSFTTNVSVSIAVTPSDASIFYTKNGTHPASGGIPYTGPFTVDSTTTLIAYARKAGMLDSDTSRITYELKKGKSKVLTPEISPNGATFSGTQKVTLFCATTGAVMRYTLDGKTPDSTSTAYPAAGITLNKTATLKVAAFLKDWETSDVATAAFKLGPGLITAIPAADIIFEGSISVRLQAVPATAEIRYTSDGTAPTKDSPLFPAGGVTLTNTTTLSAVAFLEGVAGTVQSFSYTRKGGPLATPTPLTAGGAFTFKDTVRVALYSTPDAQIYFTTDDSEPAFTAANLYKGAILLDATTTLKAIATKTGFDNSKMMVATYTLVPEKPKMSKTGGSYPLPIEVTLDCSSRKADIYWTLDGTVPTAETGNKYVRGSPIAIQFSGTLKAVAVAGNQASPVAEETYRHFQVQDTVLSPGQTLFLEGNYTLRNPENEKALVQVRIADPDPLRLTGFDGVQFALNLSLANAAGNTGLEFPKLTFTTSSSEKRSLYKVEPSGQIYFVTTADTLTINQGGAYFLGVDISPPKITYLSESYDPQDSTRVDFQVDDNVANLVYDINRNDDPARALYRQNVFSGQQVGSRLKHPAGTLKPLYVQLIVSDHQQAAFHPADPRTMLSLSQKLTRMEGPNAWKIGAFPKSLYDFVGIPLPLDPALTLKDLRDLNPGAGIEGAEYSNADGKFMPLAAGADFKSGRGFWVAARSPISSLKLPRAATLPSGSGVFKVYLRHGWNQIANPHMEDLFWPYARALGETYKTFPIKGLWEWNPSLETPDYVEADTLKPWRGYFVYNNLGDTEVELSPRPPGQGKSSSLAKFGGGASMHVTLGWGPNGSLRLGADRVSANGLGMEDESALPGKSPLRLNAVREGRALISDWVRMDYSGVSTWRVAMGGAGDSLPPLKVGGQELPEGWEAWALAPSRGMRFRLDAGREVPASGLAQDTLLVVAGPKDKLARLGLMQTLALSAPDLDLRIAPEPGGFQVGLSLPSKARVRATLWTLDGRAQGSLVQGPLSGGAYRFAYARDFQGRPARLSPGMYFLSLEVKGPGVNARLSRKLVLAR